MLATEMVIQKIQDRSDEMKKVIDRYEQNSIAKFEAEDEKKSKKRQFIDHIESLHKTCSKDPINVTLQDIENYPTRLRIENIDKRLQEETKSLEN